MITLTTFMPIKVMDAVCEHNCSESISSGVAKVLFFTSIKQDSPKLQLFFEILTKR